jgi:hypothetical protein
MGESVRVLVEEASKTAEARRFARRMAANIGLNDDVAEQVSMPDGAKSFYIPRPRVWRLHPC